MKRPPLPEVQRLDWVQSPIDAFVLAALEDKSLDPAPQAAPLALLRRVFLDLIGLPPTVAEQAAFLADPSPAAYARVVDDLLSRPQYGERWARHWLDVVRYAESNGYERDGAKPNAWRYRDYVIASLNDDKPYDRFIIEQLAGDELPGSNAETQIATTFLRLGLWDDEPADPLVDRYDQLDDVVGVTSASLLGLTLRCARCHDHKFEPFTQQDYARVLAAFEPLKRPQNNREDLDRLVGTPQELETFRNATAAVDQRVGTLRRDLDTLESHVARRLVATGSSKLPPEMQTALTTDPATRSKEQQELLAKAREQIVAEIIKACTTEETRQRNGILGEMASAEATRPAEPPRAYVWFEDTPQASPTHVFYRGDPRSPREEVAAGVPAVLVDAPPRAAAPTAVSTGRRLQLAHWIADSNHPLTARVMVNRIWQQHFGEGLVATENDFGLMGSPPSHPELLDWLAAEFVASGWKFKSLHRHILLSATYQMAAVSNPAAEASDPKIEFLWCYPSRRLQAETIRDLILSASGQLNLDAGGPSVYPKIAPAVLASQSRPGLGWGSSDEHAASRRSVYVFVKRTLPLPELEVLDQPNPDSSCEQRQTSTIAPQALTYLNGEFINQQAGLFADRLLREAGHEPAAQVDLSFRLTLCRLPTDAERDVVLQFLAEHRRQIESDVQTAPAAAPIDPERQALTSYCLMLLNTNEFVFLP
ncbi:MAG: DUF1549 and DUF1553 domain-containing protein [Pirellulales bacterium]|nr:DUF1549 and DUF1553 domain-containing protein [Pirellulales bacterium]